MKEKLQVENAVRTQWFLAVIELALITGNVEGWRRMKAVQCLVAKSIFLDEASIFTRPEKR
jgi:hypothetical protein